MIQLSVNVNKIATLRNARGGLEPSVSEFAQGAIAAGAYGITVHPRPDERHITTQDVFDLVDVVSGVEYNLEGYPDERYRSLIHRVKPAQATLVPDPPGVLTSNAGWNAGKHKSYLRDAIQELQAAGSRVSLFMETDLQAIDAAMETGADRIELYTGPYAEAFARGNGIASFQVYSRAAQHATNLGLGLNAGHDLNLANLTLFRELPGLQEVSIGHALTCDALRMGWQPAVKAYLETLK